MASRFLGVLSLMAIAGSCMAGIATYAYNPYTTTYHAPAQALTYASHTPVYHHQQPIVYHHQPAPVYTRSLVAPAHVVAKTYAAAPAHYVNSIAAPVVKTYAAPVAHVSHVSPVLTKTLVAAPVLKQVEYESSPRYDFSYGVHDSVTGDIKSQVESRNGGNVAGSYSLVDADGYKRTVTYTADDVNGFNAVVQREPIITKLAAVAAAPVVSAVATPVHHVPVQQQQHFQYLPQAPLYQQQHFTEVQQQAQQQYLPTQEVQQPQEQQEQQLVEEQPQQPEVEPTPVEYPEQQQEQQQQPQQQPEEQQPQPQEEYPQGQDFPPYPQYEIPQAGAQENSDDSDVIEARSANSDNSEQSNNQEQQQPQQEQQQSQEAQPSTTAAPAPVTEDQKETETPKSA